LDIEILFSKRRATTKVGILGSLSIVTPTSEDPAGRRGTPTGTETRDRSNPM